jgi:hypothetical protein
MKERKTQKEVYLELEELPFCHATKNKKKQNLRSPFFLALFFSQFESRL